MAQDYRAIECRLLHLAGQAAWMKTRCCSPRSRAAGVTIVARRSRFSGPASSPAGHLLRRRNRRVCRRRRGSGDGGVADRCGTAAQPPRSRHGSGLDRSDRRRIAPRGQELVDPPASGSAASRRAPATTGAFGSCGPLSAAGAGCLPDHRRRDLYASRLMFNRCRGEMLSDVMFPPYPPTPTSSPGPAPSSIRSTRGWSAS